MEPRHLAPGDRDSLLGDWADVELHRIASPDDPFFQAAYDALWHEFGEAGEMESVGVICQRMEWAREEPLRLRYHLDLVIAGGKLAAVRDHTIILREGVAGAVVHLSHNLVVPAWRRSGLAGWMRALPVRDARAHLAAAGRAPAEPVVLAGEMEPLDERHTPTATRLMAYTRAGFLTIDPARAPYLQPDFRPPDVIDASGGPRPVPLELVIRRVGRETETEIPAEEARGVALSLYAMYARGFRAADMEPVFAAIADWPASGPIPLVAPYRARPLSPKDPA